MPCPAWESPEVSELLQGPSLKLPGRRHGHSMTWTKHQIQVQVAISRPTPQELHPTCRLNSLVSSNQCPLRVKEEALNSPLQRISHTSHLREPTPRRLLHARISLQPSNNPAAKSTRTQSHPSRSPETMQQPITGPRSIRRSPNKPRRMLIQTS